MRERKRGNERENWKLKKTQIKEWGTQEGEITRKKRESNKPWMAEETKIEQKIKEIERRLGWKEKAIWKIAFWNVAGITNKDMEFWNKIKEWDVITLIETFLETWLDRKAWSKVKDKLSKSYKWEVQYATKKNKKGSAMGGMLMGIRRNMFEIKGFEIEEEGLMTEKIKIGEESWQIIGV